MKKLILILALCALACLMMACAVGAATVYLEEIPSELTFEGDTKTHFVVFEEEKYYTGSGATISGFNTEEMVADMAAAGIDATKIGTEYLTRFNVPAYFNGTLVTYVNLNSMKNSNYFKNVCGYVQLAGTVNKIHDMNQTTSQLRCFDFGENSQVKEIPYCFAPGSQNLFSVKNFPRNLDIVHKEAFNNSYSAFSGELYLNAKVIDETAFNNALNRVTSIVFGPDTASLGRQSLCVRISEVPSAHKPKDQTLPLTTIEFQCDVSQVTFATQGNNLGVFYFTGTSRSPYSNLKSIILSHPNNASKITEGSVFNDFTAEGVTVLFNDSDGLDDFVAASHSFTKSTVTYDDFLKAGVKSVVCAKCGYAKTESAPAIFECLGYSASEFAIAFTIGYAVDYDAMAQYESATGLSVGFGFVAAVKEFLGTNMPLDENGQAVKLSKGAVINAYLGSESDRFFASISGLTTDEQMAAPIVICGYVLVTDGGGNIVDICYLQDEKTTDGSLFAISYNSIINK